jgi:protein involved in polysaccharide export with SLBB domain
MIEIRNCLKNKLILLMIFLMLHILMRPIRNVVYAGMTNPIPQQKGNILSNQLSFKEGDAVQISVYPDTSSYLHNVFPIDGQGYIFLPIVGKIKIVNMTEQDFSAFLNENFAQYLRTPVVQVRPLIRASLLGGFVRPDLYYIDPNQTLWDLVHLAGGTLSEDGLIKMKWSRDNKTIKSNLISYYQSGKSLSQIGFHSGDQIWTPTPREGGFWNSIIRYGIPFISLGLTIYTIYISTQLSARYR